MFLLNDLRVYDWAAVEIIRASRNTRFAGLTGKQLKRAERVARTRDPIFINANNPLPYDASVIAAVNAFTVLLNSGFIKIYTGAQPALNGAASGTLLATMTFGATAFPTATASAGLVTATANAITSGTAGNTGAAGYHALVKSDNTTIVATGTVGTSASDLNMNTLSITSGNTVSCSSYLVTMPET